MRRVITALNGPGPVPIDDALKQAMQKGVKVVGYDSSPATDARNVFINQADSRSIGEGQVKLICDEIPGCSGQVGIGAFG